MMRINQASLMGSWLLGVLIYGIGAQLAGMPSQRSESVASASWEASSFEIKELIGKVSKDSAIQQSEEPAAPKAEEQSAKAQTSKEIDGMPKKLGERIAYEYRVSPWMAKTYAQEAFRVGKDIGVDPYLILAVMAIESRFNPVAQSSAGAVGLMQVIPKWHPETGASEIGLTDGRANIKAGALALKSFLKQSSGNVEEALLRYNGSINDPSKRYARKVMGKWEMFRAWGRRYS